MFRSTLTIPVALALALTARADDLAILPPSATLDGPKASQRFLVEARRGEVHVGDRTSKAAFAIDNPRVATVSPEGVVTPTGDGTATLTASVGDQTAQATITVKDFARDEPYSFKNDVLPVLTKAGCNAGACHGAAAGKNGFRLTLRGYGPEIDFDVLTRQALGRRVVKTAPAESLMLLKPTGAVEHGGGVRFEPDSLEYRILSGWIAAGTPRPRLDEPRPLKVEALPALPDLRARPVPATSRHRHLLGWHHPRRHPLVQVRHDRHDRCQG